MIYTENYQLRKPVIGVDDADVKDLNYNSDRIDAIMHSTQISLADAYDENETYNTGDVVMYELLMYKCLDDNVTGTWNPAKWARTTAGENGGGGSADFDIYGEASGNPVSFVDGSASALVECEAEIVPVQDLHGYSKPWAGGAGKNKAPFFTDITTGVVTITVGNDGVCTLNGNSGSTSSLLVNNPITLEAGTYTLSDGVSEHKAQLQIYNMTTSSVYWKDTTQTFTYNGTDDIHIRLWIAGNTSFSNYKIYPMVRISSTSEDYEPYANICPISGHSSVTINVSPTSDPSQGVDITIQLGNTYYGGTLNVLTGELTVTKRIVTENDFTMMGGETSGGGLNYFQILSTDPQATSTNAISNMLEQNQSGWSSTTPCFSTNTGASPNIYPVRVYAKSTSLANFKTEYSGLQIVYTLATPQTVQLTPAEVRSILGQNYIEADSGDITVKYVKKDAPIKPNPTASASDSLNKIDIDGVVYEIEGSGGGEYFYPIIYSTTEREVGVWIDDKPLYQRTFDKTNDSLTDMAWNNNVLGTTGSGIKIVNFVGWYSYGGAPTFPYFYTRSSVEYNTAIINANQDDVNIRPNMSNQGSTPKVGIVTIWYTKNSDVAGSGSFNTLGVPMVHYDDAEQVIGTWFGETLYQKTVATGGSVPSGATLIERIVQTNKDTIKYTKA